MTPEERSDINNGIWLCYSHSVMIDKDENTFTAQILLEMKASHEKKVQEEMYKLLQNDISNSLFMIGSDIIFSGCLRSIEKDKWIIYIREFLRGEKLNVVDYVSQFSEIENSERVIIAESISDGREMTDAPMITFENGSLTLICKVSERSKRIRAQEMGSDLALDESGDLGLFNGDLKLISGIDRLPQHLMMCLSTQKGEVVFHPEVGSNLSEYYHLFRNTIWLDRIFCLEIIKNSSIRSFGRESSDVLPPLQCVDRVYDVKVISELNDEHRILVNVALDVKGIGKWEHDIKVYIHQDQLI